MRRRFVTFDVFTARRFAGNPLAVVLDADGLDNDTMQAIAREFNFSETVFVLPPRDPAHRARLRIFNPVAELPFAGHPTVGTAVLLNRIDGGGTREIVLEEGVGPISCSTASLNHQRGHARFRLARLPEEVGEAADAETVATALGLQKPGSRSSSAPSLLRCRGGGAGDVRSRTHPGGAPSTRPRRVETR